MSAPTVAYDPLDKPVVGGYSATFSKMERQLGRSTAMAATKRVVASEPYEPTGDEAFDLRVQAFRGALLAGTPEAFEESHLAFRLCGLYWQGTYGNPKRTKDYSKPPTNSQNNYKPNLWALMSSEELQDWMVKDFNYAAWLWVQDTPVYKSRKRYVEYADQLLPNIPGPHQAAMSTWPVWDIAKSPPPHDAKPGEFPNDKYVEYLKLHPEERKETASPKVAETKSEMGIEDGPAEQNLPVAPSKPEELLPIEPAKEPATIEAALKGEALHQPATLPTEAIAEADLRALPPPPGVEHDAAISDSSSSIAGLRPATLEAKPQGITTPEGMVKHVAVMGGIGVGVGAAIAGTLIALRHLKIWPFNRKNKAKSDDPTSGALPGGRLHARDWKND